MAAKKGNGGKERKCHSACWKVFNHSFLPLSWSAACQAWAIKWRQRKNNSLWMANFCENHSRLNERKRGFHCFQSAKPRGDFICETHNCVKTDDTRRSSTPMSTASQITLQKWKYVRDFGVEDNPLSVIWEWTIGLWFIAVQSILHVIAQTLMKPYQRNKFANGFVHNYHQSWFVIKGL